MYYEIVGGPRRKYASRKGKGRAMSVKITVSWHFMLPGLPNELGSPYVDFGDSALRGDVPFMNLAPDRVLPLGSSVVAPGLAVLMPA
jgi:hypothetical protein